MTVDTNLRRQRKVAPKQAWDDCRRLGRFPGTHIMIKRLSTKAKEAPLPRLPTQGGQYGPEPEPPYEPFADKTFPEPPYEPYKDI